MGGGGANGAPAAGVPPTPFFSQVVNTLYNFRLFLAGFV